MFLFYFIWSFLFFLISFFRLNLENFFLFYNNPFLIRKRTFKFLSYFEKLFLILFHENNWFEKSIANLYRKKDIVDYRKNFYPIIYSFHINFNKSNYFLEDLSLVIKQFSFLKKNLNKKHFINFLIFQNIFIKNYFNFNSFFYFFEKNKLNIIKFNIIFNIFLQNSKKKLVYFNLDRWEDWYVYNFNKNLFKNNLSFLKNNQNYFNNKYKNNKYKKFKKNRLKKWINIVNNYKKSFYIFNNFFKIKLLNILFFKFNFNNFFKIIIDKNFKNFYNYYLIKFSESSINKYINSGNINNYNLQYLRKNRIFNKGRYSRNRQLYRTGVYWCLWLNIIMVYGLYFMFYRFTFNFGYFWWGLLILSYSTIFSRISKYNFYNLNFLLKEFISLLNWYGFILLNLNYLLFFRLNLLFKKFNNFSYLNFLNNKFIFLNNFYYWFLYFFNIFKNKNNKINYIWEGMKEKDNSLFRYKTIIHWFKEIWRLIIT